PTLTALCSKITMKYWEDKKLDLTNFQRIGKYLISDFQGIFTPRGLRTTGTMGMAYPLFINSYRGGRNESFTYGIDKDTTWYDYDLSGAYPTAMSLLGIPDLNKIIYLNTTESVEEVLKGENILKAYTALYIKFKFPDDTKYPCLPVTMGDSLTIYPLS